MAKTKEDYIKRVVKMFGYDKPGAGTETEILLMMTKAKEIMVEHNISQEEVQRAMDIAAKKAGAKAYDIRQHNAFTRKMARLSHYDELVASAVGHLTTTSPFTRTIMDMDGKTYVSMMFVGEVADVELASALFMILLKTVRRRARENYGHGKNEWTKQHTSYAVGFAGRLCVRAQEMSGTLSTKQQTEFALVVQGKREAIARAMPELTPGKERKTKYDKMAQFHGYIDGADEVLDKRGIS